MSRGRRFSNALLFADDDHHHHPLLLVLFPFSTQQQQAVQTAVEQLGYADRSDVTSLILDEKCTSHDIEGLDGFENLKTLSLIRCGVASLADLPNLPELRKLNVSQNRISNSGMMRHVAKQCPKLEQLIVCDNPKLTKVEEFTALTALKRLERIDAEGCNFEEEDHARLIFEMFPEGQMKNVDGYNEKGEEVYSDSEDDSEEDDGDDEEEEDVDDDEENDDGDDEEDDDVVAAPLSELTNLKTIHDAASDALAKLDAITLFGEAISSGYTAYPEIELAFERD